MDRNIHSFDNIRLRGKEVVNFGHLNLFRISDFEFRAYY